MENSVPELPVAPCARGLQKFTRKWSQFKQLLFMNDFAPREIIAGAHAPMIARYNSRAEIQFYEKFTAHGLLVGEKEAVHSLSECMTSALVVGCGTGREAFALAERGFAVTGLDIAEKMVEGARELNRRKGTDLEFTVADFMKWRDARRFDFVFLTFGITGHIYGEKRRREFLVKAARHLNPGGLLLYGPDILDLRHSPAKLAASQILRLKWFGRRAWQAGDTVRSFLGRHNNTSDLFYFHYYQSEREFLEQARAAGLELEREFDGYYLMRVGR